MTDFEKAQYLYCMDARGAIREWRIQVITENAGSTIEIRYGLKDGNLASESQRIKDHGHRISANKIALSRYTKQMQRKGYTIQIPDSVPLFPMLASPFKASMAFPEEVILQPKINGARCFMSKGRLSSRTNREITCAPHLNKLSEQLDPEVILDGELFSPGPSFQKLIGLINRGDTIPECRTLEYRVFDIACATMTQEQRLDSLYHIINNMDIPNKNITMVPTIVRKPDNLHEHMNAYVDQGFEGLIIRIPTAYYQFHTRSSQLIKLKPYEVDLFYCVDIVDSAKRPKEAILVCSCPGSTFKVTLIGSRTIRKKVFTDKERFIGKAVKVTYLGISDDNKPIQAKGEFV